MKIGILNGPGLNRIGEREPAVYGSKKFDDALEQWRNIFPDVEISYFQSNCEGAIIDCIQQFIAEAYDGLIINPGAYAHYSYAIADAIGDAMNYFPVVEVHISNIAARETFRHESVTAARAKAFLSGFGIEGYEMAIRHLLSQK